jgi:hypothetical protein
MTGPNDIGVLRGIIGDGTSMNDEDVKRKASGKRPGHEHPMPNAALPNFPPDKMMKLFNGQSKNAMDVMSKFSLNKRIDPNTPHVVSKILRDNYGLNKLIPAPGEISTMSTADKDAIVQKLLPNQKIIPIPERQTLSIPKPRNIREEQQTALRDVRREKDFAKEQRDLARYESERTAAERRTQELQVPEEQGYSLKTVKTGTIALPMPRLVDAQGKQLEQTGWKGALQATAGLFSGKTKITTKLSPEEFARRVGQYQLGGLSKKDAIARAKATEKYNYYQGSITAAIPTKSGIKRFAGDLAENLGASLASPESFVGSYQPRGYKEAVRDKQLQLASYVQTLQKRHPRGGESSYTPAERLRLQRLKQSLAIQQQEIAQQGFMGGGRSGMGIITGSQPRSNMQQFTEIGGGIRPQFSELGQGIAGPESMARLGVGQGMSAIDQNKWDIMLNRRSPSDKITTILGKQPDPTGQSGESAAAKIKRLSGL